MIYVCVLTHNRLEKVQRCMMTIQPAITAEKAMLCVLDQASTDGTAAFLRQVSDAGAIQILKLSKENLMAIGGRHTQIEWLVGGGLAPDDVVVFLDSDVVAVEHDWLSNLIKPLNHPNIDICGVYGRNIMRNWKGFVTPHLVPHYVDVVSGGMTAVTGAVLLEGVNYDLDYLPFWHADSDFVLQARSKGFYAWCCGDVGLRHTPEHHETDELYFRNFEKLKSKWAGKGLVKHEREVVRGFLNSS